MKKLFTAALLFAAATAGAQSTNPAPYCTGAFTSTQDFITSVSVGSLSNNTTGMVSATGYDYYNNVAAPTLNIGSNYTATINFANFPTVHYVGVFIDYDRNNSFDDPGELVLNQFITNQQGQPTSPATQSFLVPASATTGQTRMRVILLEDDDYTFSPNGQPAGPYSCVPTPAPSNFQMGQTQDYNVTIGGGATQQPPSATVQAATAITINSATLNGIVTANGAATTVVFEYGTTTAYGQTINANPASIAGNTSSTVSAPISGLAPNTTYHFRVKATNSGGTGTSPDMTFQTSVIANQPPPTAIVGTPANVTGIAAQFTGLVNAKGDATSVSFEYGTTTAYGQTIAATPATVTGTTDVAVSGQAVGLQPNTTYHYRVKASNGGGTTVSTDMVFTTTAFQPTPVVTTYNASTVSLNSATLNGMIIANGAPTTAVFEYGLTNAYGQTVDATPDTVGGSVPTSVSAVITGLVPNKTYHFRLRATNSGGTGSGSNRTFKTTAMGVINFDTEKAFSIVPNPSNGVVQLLWQGARPQQPVKATFFNSLGQAALQTLTDGNGMLRAEVLPAGLYQLRLSDAEGNVEVHSILIQK